MKAHAMATVFNYFFQHANKKCTFQWHEIHNSQNKFHDDDDDDVITMLMG
jgi:phosphomevalonate kinase